MSRQRLPSVPVFQNKLENYEISMRMGQHRRKIDELKGKKINRINSTIGYKQLLDENPKRNYFLETKYTEIERENRLLFQKIANYNKPKKQSPASHSSHHHIRSLNMTFRKQQIEDIERENVKMFGRIQKQKASISFRDTDKQYMKTRRLSNRLSTISKHQLHDWY